MALRIGSGRVGALYVGGTAVAVLYRGGVRVWEAVRSCFGRGVWRPAMPWRGDDVWKN